jgi:ribosomal-protein-alanine N-acetyltransferase
MTGVRAAGVSTTVVPEVAGDGVLLGPWRDEDAPAVLEIARDPQTSAWSPSLRPVRTLGAALEWMRSRAASDGRVDWAVRDPASFELVGRVGLHHFEMSNRVAEIGYGVHPAHRRRGVARRAVGAATTYGFTLLGLQRISLIHASGNPASCAVATTCGYVYEGTERSMLDHGDGVLHDAHRHARLVTDPPGRAEPAPDGLRPVVLPGDGLTLRPWEATDADAEAVLVGLGDPLASRWNPRLPLPDLAAARAWLHGRAERWRDGRAGSWAVVVDGRIVGSIGLREINRMDGFAVAAYWTMPAERGRGIAVRALTRVATYAFDDLGLHRVELSHAVQNTASCRVAEKAGFRLEGAQRESTRLAEGYVDEHVHARLASDR